ncbi:hypothetical protein [Nostoc sp.]|uniref:hypothetical protein n=1 Tax=Nostoc sp. TaxID=1180 RepID=UPI002FF5C264
MTRSKKRDWARSQFLGGWLDIKKPNIHWFLLNDCALTQVACDLIVDPLKQQLPIPTPW